jgi:anti-anti-sigma factor
MKLDIKQTSQGELLLLHLSGDLDNDSSQDFREAIDEAIATGYIRVIVRFTHVSYISSAGIGVLIASKKRLVELNGLLGIYDLNSHVEMVLRQTKLLDHLQCDADSLIAKYSSAFSDAGESQELTTDDGIEVTIQTLGSSSPKAMSLELYGNPSRIQRSVLLATDGHRLNFPTNSIGLGLGTLAAGSHGSQDLMGEILAVGGAVAQSPREYGLLPDFAIAQEEYVPAVELMYGLRLCGDFSYVVRFNRRPSESPLTLSRIVNLAAGIKGLSAAAVVVLGECAGVVGTQLTQSPVQSRAQTDAQPIDRFEFPSIRDWLSFGGEQIHLHSMVLAGGVLVSAAHVKTEPSLTSFLRPLSEENWLGHFHAAVFPFRPLKRTALDLNESVTDLFNSESLKDVVHLLCDSRPNYGAGETEFNSCAVWVAPLNTSPSGELPQ